MSNSILLLVLSLFLFNSSCVGTKPCEGGGDVSWHKKIKGDRHCYQIELEDGNVVNHGEFTQEYMDGKVAVKGYFKEGKKHGIWEEFNEKGEKVMEKYFENGVDKPNISDADKDPLIFLKRD